MNRLNLKSKLGSVAGFVLILAIYGVTTYLTHGDTDVSRSADYLTTDTSSRPFTSTKFNFTVDFPGFPTTTNSSMDVMGINVPYTFYDRYNEDVGYMVAVFEYPMDFDMSDTDARLEGALNGSVQNVEGSTLVSSSFGQFLNYRSISGHAVVDSDGQTIDVYSLVFLNDQTMFMLSSSGVGQSNFNTFRDSFIFNN